MSDLVEGLQVSKSSVSTAARTLRQIGLIERISLPGIRQDFHRITEGVWLNAIHQQANQATGLRKLAERGLELTAHQSSEQQKQLREMRDLYAFVEDEIPRLLERWEEIQMIKELERN